VIVSVPRQTGKTTLIRAVGTHRCLVCGRDVFYTAQTAKDAKERWTDLVKVLRVNDALRDRVKVSLRGGSEQVAFQGGGAFRVFAPTPESLHGYTPPTVCIDEAFALSGAKGELLMGAIGPAQITVTDKQIWIVSTAGTAESTFLHEWIDRAVEGMPRVAVFVWGATDEQDPFNPEHIAAFHPGVGFPLNGKVLTAHDVLEQADRNSRAEYERAYANRRTVTLSHLIPAERWRALEAETLTPPDLRRVVVSYDVAPDRQSAAILATWIDDQGHPVTKIAQAGPGISWLAPAVAALDRDWRPAATAAVDNGPVLEVTEQLRALGVDVEVLKEREFATASGAFLSRIDHGSIHHDGSDLLELSVTGLVTRSAVSDGVAFSRRHSIGDSSPAVAAVVGAWVAARDDLDTAPMVRFAS
jgi:Phage terminase-like protein, large subunit